MINDRHGGVFYSSTARGSAVPLPSQGKACAKRAVKEICSQFKQFDKSKFEVKLNGSIVRRIKSFCWASIKNGIDKTVPKW